MDERARLLARSPAPPRAVGRLELVAFGLGEERYAVESSFVTRILREVRLTRVPGAPPPLRGVLGLQGEVVAVFDLRLVLQGRPSEPSEAPRVLVLGEQRPELALLVDGRLDVERIDEERLAAPGAPVAAVAPELVKGVTPEALVVLNARALLRGPRFVVDAAPARRKERL